MAKKYWACYHAGEIKLAPGKHENSLTALDAAFGDRTPLDDGTNARPLGTRKAEALEAYAELEKAHRAAMATQREAHEDVESEALERVRRAIEDYERYMDTFTEKLRKDGPAEALRWHGDDLIEMEFRANRARHVLRMVQENGTNPVKALRLVKKDVEAHMLEDRYTNTSSGIFSRPVGDAMRAAGSNYLRHFAGNLWPLHMADRRDAAREKLGLEPIDYEAPYHSDDPNCWDCGEPLTEHAYERTRGCTTAAHANGCMNYQTNPAGE